MVGKDEKKKKKSTTLAEIGDFPRGGSNGLTPLEYREVARQADREAALFSDGVTQDKKQSAKRKKDSAATDKMTKKKKKNKNKESEPSLDNPAEGEDLLIEDEQLSPVESLTFRRLTKGALVLGCVSAIRELELLISLPNGLTGVVPITSISTELTVLVKKAAESQDSDDDDDEDTRMDVDSEDSNDDDPLDLSQRFYIGQYVKCVVAELESGNDQDQKQKKSFNRIELSMVPGEINSRLDLDDICIGQLMTASIKSVEDRGYVLNLGIPGDNVAAFLPSDATQTWMERWMPDSSELKIGQLVEAAVTKVSDDHRSLRFSIDPSVVSQSLVKDTYKTMASVQPGQVVSAMVMKVWNRGLSLRFMGFYDCSADLNSLGLLAAHSKDDVMKKYDLGDTVNVRVLYVSLTTAAKTIIVSTLPHIMALKPRPASTGYESPEAARLASGVASITSDSTVSLTKDAAAKTSASGNQSPSMFPIPYGTILDDCVVASSIQKVGLVLQIPGVDSVIALATLANIVEDGEDMPQLHQNAGKFRTGTYHRVRVVGYDAMDAIVRVSLRPSIVDQPFFTIDDVQPGAVISGTVKLLKDNGAEITISSTLQGFVHKNHLSDVALKHPELLFKPGKQMTCRVLRVDPTKNSIILTCRKSLVQSKLPAVTGFTGAEGAAPNTITTAVVDRVLNHGVLVSFYQKTYGLVSTTKKLDVGQVVKCRILSADPNKRRIWASLNLDPDVTMDDDTNSGASQSVSVGDIVSGTVVRVDELSIDLQLDESKLRVTMPTGHLSDLHGAMLDKVVARIKPGAVINELVVVGVKTRRGQIMVSAKPALIQAAKNKRVPTSSSEIIKGKTLVGWVTGTTNFGVFVTFPSSVSALASLSNLSDRYVQSPSELFQEHQTVIAHVVSVEETEGSRKISVSLKASSIDVAATGCVKDSDFLLEYFGELEGESGSELLSQIGSQTLVSVKQKHPYGIVVAPIELDSHGIKSKTLATLPSSSSGFVTLDQAKDRLELCTENAVVAACVLDIDPEKEIVDYSLRKTLVPTWESLESAAGDNGKIEGSGKGKKDALLKKELKELNTKTVSNRKALETACKQKTAIKTVVEVVKEDYLVLSLPDHGNAIAFSVTKSYNDRSKPFMRFKTGQRLTGVPVRVTPNSRRTLIILQASASDSSQDDSKAISSVDKRAAVNPIDPSISYFEDYIPGMLTRAKVKSIKGTQANLGFAANVKGRLHVTELFDKVPDVHVKSPADIFAAAGVEVGKEIPLKVIGWHDAKVYKFLPISHRVSPLKTVIEATIRPSELQAAESSSNKMSDEDVVDNDETTITKREINIKTLEPGTVFHGFVRGVQDSKQKGNASVLVALNVAMTGHLPIMFATSSLEVAEHPARFFFPGSPIEVCVSRVNPAKNSITLVPHGTYINGVERPLKPGSEHLVPGASVICSVTAITPAYIYTRIHLVEQVDEVNDEPPRVIFANGNIDRFHVADKLVANPFVGYEKNQLLEAKVVSVNDPSNDSEQRLRIGLSIRPTAMDPVKFPASGAEDPLIETADDVSVGQIVHGYITQTNTLGCFVDLGTNISGRALISELSDEYIRDVKGAFPAGKLVAALVTDIHRERNHIALSMKPSRVGGGDIEEGGAKLRRLDQIDVGETLKGTVNRTEDYGVFIKPDDAFITGLCYVREIADSDDPVDPKTLYEVGDRVLAKVLKVDIEKNRLALGLKASYFANDSEGSDEEMVSAASEIEDVSADEDSSDEEEQKEEESSDDDEEEEETSGPALTVTGGFKWGDDEEEDDDDDIQNSDDSGMSSDEENDDEEIDDTNDKKKKKSKKSKQPRVVQDITAELSEQAPKSSMDFERLIVGSPNSSFVWMQFMAFYVSQSEIDQARNVAERALKTISPREEQEKMNIWVGLLNLEHRFGDEESLESVLKRALQYMNPKHIYLQMAKIYERAEQWAEAEKMHSVAISKFPESCKVWVLFGLYYLKHGKVTESRDLLARALKSQLLPKRKHIKTISQFGQMEFKHGEPERGRTVFEGVLGTYPKRVDLWSVYLDMEVKVVTSRDLQMADDGSGKCWNQVRKLFERVTSMKHSSKKMKFFFKKWLSFEKTHGTDATEEHVKQRALEYVNSLAG